MREELTLYQTVIQRHDSDYYMRLIKELNDQFNFLWVEPVSPLHMPVFQEEQKMEEPDAGQQISDLEVKDPDLDDASSSQVLIDIYGPKIKQDITWYFEQPVVMVEKQKMGALGDKNPQPARDGGIKPFVHFNLAPDYGDEYGAEEDPALDQASKKYQMIEGKRYQRIFDETATTHIEQAYQNFLTLPVLSIDSYLEVSHELYYIKFVKYIREGALKQTVMAQVKNTGT